MLRLMVAAMSIALISISIKSIKQGTPTFRELRKEQALKMCTKLHWRNAQTILLLFLWMDQIKWLEGIPWNFLAGVSRPKKLELYTLIIFTIAISKGLILASLSNTRLSRRIKTYIDKLNRNLGIWGQFEPSYSMNWR